MAIDPADFQRHNAEHLGKHHISIEQHLDNKRAALGASISGKQRIYLDTNYWVLLREAMLGQPRRPTLTSLLDLLRQLVSSGKAICPASEAIFVELLKQSDPTSRRATAELMDELGQGITILSSAELVRTEFTHFLLDTTQQLGNVRPLDQLLWTKACFVLGTTYPARTPFDAEDELRVQKAFSDYCWEFGFTRMMDNLGDNWQRMLDEFDQLAAQLNEEKPRYAHEIASFDQARRSEIAGVLDIYAADITAVFKSLHVLQTGQRQRQTEAELQASMATIKAHLLALFTHDKQRKLAKRLPCLYINANLHAAVRWDEKRKFKPNDFLDFHHATSALPYFQVFLTERPLHVLTTANHMKLDALYGCKVISDDATAIQHLTHLLASS